MKRLMEDFFNVPGGLFLLLGWIALTVNAPYLGLPVAVVVIYWWSARRKARTASTPPTFSNSADCGGSL